jgi:hypothetical protein
MAGQTRSISSRASSTLPPEELPPSTRFYRASRGKSVPSKKSLGSTLTERALIELLTPFSDEVEKRTAPHAEYANGRLTGVPLVEADELRALCDSSVYIAFAELGGNPDRPDLFDPALGNELIEQASLSAYNIVRGVGSSYRDWSQRWRNRASGRVNDCFKWSAWTNAGDSEDDTCHTHNSMIDTSDDPFLPKCVAQSWDVDGLITALKTVLSESDAISLVEHYINEKPVEQMALEELAAFNVIAPDADLVKKTRMAIYQRICRARTRAAKKLGTTWAARAEEIN